MWSVENGDYFVPRRNDRDRDRTGTETEMGRERIVDG